MNTSALYRLAVDLYAGQKTPEQVRALCEAMEAFLDVSALYKVGDISYWEWVRELERVRIEMGKI